MYNTCIHLLAKVDNDKQSSEKIHAHMLFKNKQKMRKNFKCVSTCTKYLNEH